MKDKVFIFIVCLILLLFSLSSPVIAVLSMAGYLDALNTKNYIVTEKTYEDSMPASGVLNKIEQGKTFLKNVYINCIPFYGFLVSSVQSAEMSMLHITDNFIQTMINKKEDISIVTAPVNKEETDAQSETGKVEIPKINYYSLLMGGNGRPDLYAIEPLKVMERVEAASDKELQKLTERQLRHIHRLKDATPGINYYIYMGTRTQDMEMYDDLITGPPSTVPYFKYFTENLDSSIKFDYFKLETPEDIVNKRYRSDHHWNIFGAYEGYKQIINMINKDSPEIGAPNEYDILKVPELKWSGSLGSSVGQNDIDYVDDFYILDLAGLPGYSGNGYKIKKMQQSYMAGDYIKNGLNFDYYGAYYPPQDKYVFDDNKTGHNLLLIGDSYSWSISTIIASHFDTTICFAQPWVAAGDVTYDYRKIIEENNITDVLILYYSSRLLFGYDACDFPRMLTD